MNIGFALTGSFCTYAQIFPIMEALAKEHQVFPIFSFSAASVDSRFGTAREHIQKAQEICSRDVIQTIEGTEPIGPKKMIDALIIAPCTGNTLAKIACGITDTAVTMAAKAHLRRDRRMLIALATNDGMSQNLKNIATLITRRSVYFVPMLQDDPIAKPHSLVAEMEMIPDALDAAMRDEQKRPIFRV